MEQRIGFGESQRRWEKDSVILSAKYIRYATLDMLKKGTYTRQIDTSHRNYQYYNPQNLPWNPSVNLGSYGLATRDLLFQPKRQLDFSLDSLP
ncbi:hypothetical protein KUH03_21575 [Sphingobacterium sp. E70]|uniref:hypothetical protein n=1 Tax=Sphingobacterium sp. E70 TaxID=2853439 RepID=UPI00211C2839|nr:hypothetical protein [Sphingobacterium sp. E70]ULT22111.1 hypothetical protein KUH03_21575 [Sphingobacterium sp. E70]